MNESSGPDGRTTAHGTAAVHGTATVRWRASIALAVGEGGPVSSIVESEHGSERSARAWIERKLPRARFPAWIPPAHRAGGAALFGRVARGHLVTGPLMPTWETDPATQVWLADRAEGRVHWRRCTDGP